MDLKKLIQEKISGLERHVSFDDQYFTENTDGIGKKYWTNIIPSIKRYRDAVRNSKDLNDELVITWKDSVVSMFSELGYNASYKTGNWRGEERFTIMHEDPDAALGEMRTIAKSKITQPIAFIQRVAKTKDGLTVTVMPSASLFAIPK